MTFQGSTIGDRLDAGRLRSPDLSSTNSTFPFGDQAGLDTSSKFNQRLSFQETRSSPHRRFTTNNLPMSNTLSPIGQPRRQQPETSIPDPNLAINHKVQLLEKKRAEYGHLQQRRIQYQEEMDLIDLQAKREEDELRRLQQDLSSNNGNGQAGEPATPPESCDNGFPTALSRLNRFSASNAALPLGLANRLSRTESQLSSPPSERARAYQALTSGGSSQAPLHTGDLEETDNYADTILDFNHRSAATLNRNSMPVTRRDRTGVMGVSSTLGHVDTSAFLFGNNYDKSGDVKSPPPGQVLGGFLHMNTNEDEFPILVRREGDGHLQMPTTSDIHDATTPDAAASRGSSNGWPSFNRPLSLQTQGHSYPHAEESGSASETSQFGLPEPQSSSISAANRHSMGAKVGPFSFEPNRPSILTSPSSNTASLSNAAQPKLLSSYSTNDIPTIASISGTIATNGNAIPMGSTAGTAPVPLGKPYPGGTAADHRFHQHNASLGRIPTSVLTTNAANYAAFNTARQSREISSGDSQQAFSPMTNGSQSTASPYPPGTAVSDNYGTFLPNSTAITSPFVPQAVYSGHNTPANLTSLTPAMNNMQLGGAAQWNGQAQTYQPPYPSYPLQQYGLGRQQDMQSRTMQQRRGQDDTSRFSHIPLEHLCGEIYGLCKDQHGCRYLQKKLEDRNMTDIQLIFEETKDHMVELMTDPFGNYLCQKLLEFTNDDQRTALINNAAPDMIKIALNQHGTRALQKMIDFVSTEEQIETIIYALKNNVVPMIQDLNGNHVVQKCLNKLASKDAQFIFDAVAMNCVTVGTHRHGCCVIQRCIDHSTGPQRAQLVAAVTKAAFPLVQDPFGNYVLQYIFDQGEEQFSQPLCRAFLGNIAILSRQKFSSNVIEKCIRIADSETKHLMVEEIVYCPDFERLVDDAFANYVVQTAWDYAEPADEAILAQKLRPVLPKIRHKPYGRRFQSRLQERDKRVNDSLAHVMSPHDSMFPATGYHPYQNSGNPYSGVSSPVYGAYSASPPPYYEPTANHYRPAPQATAGPYNNSAATASQTHFTPASRSTNRGMSYY